LGIRYFNLDEALKSQDFCNLLDIDPNKGTYIDAFTALATKQSRAELYNLISEDGINPLSNLVSTTNLFSNLNIYDIEIPDTCTHIGNFSFHSCATVINLTIGENVELIGPAAFQNCIAIKEVTIPKSVKEIGYLCFGGCVELHTVTILNPEMVVGINAIPRHITVRCYRNSKFIDSFKGRDIDIEYLD
jgi:hypothetical protein